MIYSAEQMFVVFNNIVSDTACGSDIPEVNLWFFKSFFVSFLASIHFALVWLHYSIIRDTYFV